MLKITIPATEIWDAEKQEFSYLKEQTLVLEHSLVAISKWESKWHKPYLEEDKERTREQIIDYVRCMTITSNVNPEIYNHLTASNWHDIQEYMNDPMTATKITNRKPSGHNKKGQFITSELIYYWMLSAGIPKDFEKWHINRLFTLIRVCNAENAPKKKRSAKDVMRAQSELNKSRRQAMNSKG